MPLILVNPYQIIRPGTGAVLTPRGSFANGADTSTYTFSGVSIGSAQSDRRVVVAFRGLSLNTTIQRSVTMTIGGAPATIVLNPTSGVNSMTRAIGIASIPTGTTTSIVITNSGACASGLMAVYTLTGTSVPDIPLATSHAAGNTLTGINTTAGSVALLMAVNVGANTSWSGDIVATPGPYYSFEGSLATTAATLGDSTPISSNCTYGSSALGVMGCVW